MKENKKIILNDEQQQLVIELLQKKLVAFKTGENEKLQIEIYTLLAGLNALPPSYVPTWITAN